MSIFITGTDTNVGKTITSGLLIKKYSKKFTKIRYWKPIQTGYPPDDDSKTVQSISGLSEEYFLKNLKFKAPVSPHYAAELENQEISINNLIEKFINYSKYYSLIVEGAGGILVPLTRNYFWIDFIRDIKIPVVIVARSTLGTINHTLLTIEVLKQRNIEIIGIVFCGKQDEAYIRDNRKIINEISKIPIISYFDYYKEENIDPDPNLIIEKYL